MSASNSAWNSLFTITIDKTPEERAKLLETTPLFADIHAEAASSGQTQVPTDLDTDLHFTCFVSAPRVRGPKSLGEYRIVELDGRRAGPVDRGECEGDFLQVSRDHHYIKHHNCKLLSQAVAKIVKENYLANSSSMQFSMVALCPGSGDCEADR